MHTDPIADLLTRIRNASQAHHYSAVAPYSKVKEGILKILKERGFIEDFKVDESGQFKELEVVLKEDKKITLTRASKPGQRIYLKKDQLRSVKSGLGITIVSTSKGLMTNYEARKANLGGELICEVY